MPASASFSSAGLLDTPVAGIMRAVPHFVGTAADGSETLSTGPLWKCEKINLRIGARASEAQCHIPLATLHDTARAIVGVGGGPMDLIKCNVKAAIKEYSPNAPGGSIRFLGRVVDIMGEIDSDMAEVYLQDARYDLEGLVILGSFWADSSGTISYRQSQPAHPNRFGQPNCKFSGGLPFFTHANYGLRDGMTVPKPSEKNELRATHWTPKTLLAYLRWAMTYGVDIAHTQGHPEYMGIDEDFIDWPEDFASGVDDQNIALEKKAPEWPMDGNNVNHIIAELLQFSSYGLYVSPGTNSGKNVCQMSVLPTRYSGGGLTPLCASTGPASQQMGTPNVITRGTIRKSIRNTYSRVVAVGATVAIEARAGTNDHLIFALKDSQRHALETKLKLTRNLLHDDGSGYFEINDYTEAECLTLALRHYPNYGATYYIDPNWDFQVGTPEAGRHLGKHARPVLPHTLTSILADSSFTDDHAGTSQKRPVLPETFVDPAPTYTAPTSFSTVPAQTPNNPPPADDGSGYVPPPLPAPKPPDDNYDYNGGGTPPGGPAPIPAYEGPDDLPIGPRPSEPTDE